LPAQDDANAHGGQLLSTVKRALGRQYRRAQRATEHFIFERGLQSTWTEDVSSGYLYLARGLWRSKVSRQDVLLDYGSGRGRMLLAAARYPFGRVIGLELNEADAEFARANAKLAAERLRCRRIDVVVGDATVWPVPDEVTYIYMFNPFWGETFEAMLDRVIESLERRPRPLTIVYANPTCATQLLARGRFERVRTSRGPRRKLAAQRVDTFRTVQRQPPGI
jgi:SAM-dependent methyltransferase